MKDHKLWVSEIFDRAAPKYGEKNSSFFNYFGRRLVDLADVKADHNVLDVATGRGAVLFPLADILSGKQIVGIDISKQMIYETSVALEKKGICGVDLIQMDAENLKFPDNTFDFVFCGFALFFFPSLSKAMGEFRRVLKPGGRLSVSIWGKDSNLDNCINNEIDRVIRLPSLAPSWIGNGSRLQKVFQEAGFQEIQICEENKSFHYETAQDWWNSLWDHGTRSKLELLSKTQLENVERNVLAKASALLEQDGLEEKLQVFYGFGKK
jgi:ubiquinone/menaquinone biosynthesis C-methylase UbiE